MGSWTFIFVNTSNLKDRRKIVVPHVPTGNGGSSLSADLARDELAKLVPNPKLYRIHTRRYRDPQSGPRVTGR